MNKTELIAAVAEKTGMTKKDAERAVAATLETVSASLAKGERVQLSGFGILRLRSAAPALAATLTPRRPSRSPHPVLPPSRQARL